MIGAVIAEIRRETPTVKSFRLGLPDHHAFSFLPGQWVDLYLKDPAYAEPVIGGFSITSSPLQTAHIDLTIKRLPHGRASVYMHDCVRVGDVVHVDGGFGDFYFREGMSDPVTLIAGGIGITPLMSMIRFIDEAGLKVTTTLCYSARTPSELVFRHELEILARRRHNIGCRFTVTRPGEEPWTGRVGRVDREMLAEGCVSPDTMCYVCGPRSFVRAMLGNLLWLGVRAHRIKSEAW